MFMKPAKCFASLVVCLVSVLPACAQTGTITAAEAKAHVGERATVCGQVASTRFANRSKGRPTFLNLDKPYPNQIFTIVIWGEDRAKFGAPEERYRDKRVCVAGKITSYRGVPEIAVREPNQIEIEKK